jgi:hypothetical protein
MQLLKINIICDLDAFKSIDGLSSDFFIRFCFDFKKIKDLILIYQYDTIGNTSTAESK